MPRRTRCVATAHADMAGSTPRWNGFSANQTVARPARSAATASATERRGSRPPWRRRERPGSAPMRGSDVAGTRVGARLGEVRVHDPPLAVLAREDHRGARVAPGVLAIRDGLVLWPHPLHGREPMTG